MFRKVSMVASAFALAMIPVIAQAHRLPASRAGTTGGSVTGLVRGSAYTYYGLIKQGSASIAQGPVDQAVSGCDGATSNHMASTPSLSHPGYAKTGSAQNDVRTVRASGSLTLTSTTTVHGMSLFGGLVSASTVTAMATSAGTAASSRSTRSTTFVGLTIDGSKQAQTIAPNTRDNLPGIGYVILNQQTGHLKGKNESDAAVNAIVVHIDQDNSHGLLPGSEIVIGHANSKFARTAAEFLVNASSFGYQMVVASGNGSASGGRAALAEVGCTGGTATNRISAVKSTVGSAGTVVDHASGRINEAGTKANAKSTVSSVDFLAGLLRAGTVIATSRTSWSGGRWGHSGSTVFLNASNAGLPVEDSPPPNTKETLVGIGYAILNQQQLTKTAQTIKETVNGIHVYVTHENSLGAPVGSQIVYAHATSEVAREST